jgi:hypothetical protein
VNRPKDEFVKPRNDEYVKPPKGLDSKRQLKFECPEDFYQRLNKEKLRRNLTFQQMALRALALYLAFPESFHRGVDEKIKDPVDLATFWTGVLESKALRVHLSKYAHPIERVEPERARLALELRGLLEAIEGYLQQFPAEKLQLIEQTLSLDLKYYRSAREKPTTLVLADLLLKGGD